MSMLSIKQSHELFMDGSSADLHSVTNIPFLDEIHVDAVKSVSEILNLEDEWLAIDEQQDGACLFQSWYWNKEFLNHCMDNKDVEPFVLTARDSHRKLIGLLPLAIQRMKFGICLTGFSEPYQQYTDMLIASGNDPEKIFEKWMPEIKSSGADYIHLGQVRDDSNLYKAAKGLIRPSGEKDAAPFVELSINESFDDYLQSINSKTRKNMRNARNKLEKTASVVHYTHETGEALSNIIANVYGQREAWLERKGLTSRAFNDNDFGKFLSRFKKSQKNGLQFMGTSLTHGGHPIAEQLGFIYHGCYYAYISGWDNDYSHFSPGKAHLGEVLKVCSEKGLSRADFMIPAVPYKQTWATNSIGVCDYVLPLSVKGNLYNRIWLNFLRPFAKVIAYMLPSTFRAKLFKLHKRITTG